MTDTARRASLRRENAPVLCRFRGKLTQAVFTSDERDAGRGDVARQRRPAVVVQGDPHARCPQRAVSEGV